MVIFDQKSSKNNAFLVDFWSKTTVVSSLNLIKFNKTPAFYLRGYGMLMGDASQYVLWQKFLGAQMLRSVKLESAKKGHFIK